ncbi:MAG: LPS assembly lipoprotein LptE [Planctomycetota bacterium]|jgi:hypothetical protein
MRFGALLFLVAACGYTTDPDHGQTRLPSGKLPTIAVEPFDNNSFRRELEFRLTELVAREVRSRSPQAPDMENNSDWIVTGTITRAFERVLSEDTDDSVRESSFWMTCRIELRDRATDRIIGTNSITKGQPFSDRAGRFQTVEMAAEEVMREVAEATVYWLEAMERKKSQ